MTRWLWHQVGKKDYVLQNVTTKMTHRLRLHRCHVTPVYSQLNLLKLEDIHQLEIAKLMHNFHSNRMPNMFDSLFTAVNCVHTHETISSTSGQYFCHPVCSQYGKISIKFKGPRIWQQTDSFLKELSPFIFKKWYKNSIIESYKNHE